MWLIKECGVATVPGSPGTIDDPEEALRVAEEHDGPIHLLLSDVVMPGMHGPELADRLRAARPETKVLFMSAYTSKLTDPRDFLGAPEK